MTSLSSFFSRSSSGEVPRFAAFSRRSSRRSISVWSDRMSSRSMVCTSRSGSTLPSGCGISASSKARTTWNSASTVFSFARSRLSAPSPFVMPGMSTYSTVAGVYFFGWNRSRSAASRGSGTLATPRCVASEARNFPVASCEAVRVLKRVVLPAFGRPRIPSCMAWKNTSPAFRPAGGAVRSPASTERRTCRRRGRSGGRAPGCGSPPAGS